MILWCLINNVKSELNIELKSTKNLDSTQFMINFNLNSIEPINVNLILFEKYR